MVDVRWYERPDVERVLDDRERPSNVLALDLEGDTDAGKKNPGVTRSRLHDLQRQPALRNLNRELV